METQDTLSLFKIIISNRLFIDTYDNLILKIIKYKNYGESLTSINFTPETTDEMIKTLIDVNLSTKVFFKDLGIQYLLTNFEISNDSDLFTYLKQYYND